MKWFSKYMLAVYLSGIFAAGAVSGWVVAEREATTKVVVPPRPDEISKSFKERVHAKLGLSEEQQKKIDGIIDHSSSDIQAIHADHIKSLRSALNNRNAQIKGVLTAEQQQTFANLVNERYDPWKNRKWDRGSWQGRGRSSSRGDSKSRNAADCPTNNAGKPVSPKVENKTPEPETN